MRSHGGPVTADLQEFLEDPSTLYKVRAALAESGQHDVHRLDDWAVVTTAAWQRPNSRFGLSQRQETVLRPIRKTDSSRDKRAEPPPQRAQPKQPSPRVRTSKPASEPETHAHVDQDQQAQTHETAAQDGVPFCEECEKARRDREAKAGASAA